MENKQFLRVNEVSELLDVSKNKAYNVIHALNDELSRKGYVTIQGRVNKLYLYKRLNIGDQNKNN